jgi:hypothetical protein
MVERICPACRYGNTVDSHYCSKCGTALERIVPASRAPTQASTAITIAGRMLPVRWRQIGTTVAVGAAALAAEAGIAWLRRRIEAGAATPGPLARRRGEQPLSAPAKADPAQRAQSVTTIISQRVIEVTETSDGARTISDRQVWRKIDE